MSKPDTDIPAFPYQFTGPDFAPRSQHGMQLRDYFAAKAMREIKWFLEDPTLLEEAANFCYQIADAMMKARSAK